MNEEQIPEFKWKEISGSVTIEPNEFNFKFLHALEQKITESQKNIQDYLYHYSFYLRVLEAWQQMSVWTRIRYAIKGWLPEIWYLPK